MKILRIVSIVTCALAIMFVTSCASSYNAVNPVSIGYVDLNENSEVSISYKYNVLAERGNKKYAKKEAKKNISLVSIRIQNNSSQTITFSDNVKMYSGSDVVYPVEPEIVHNQLKQPTPIYLLYSLLWLTIYDCENLDCDVTPIPIGIPLTIGNMAVAGTANKSFMSELNQFNILRKEIKPNETVYGLIGIKDTGYNPLKFKIV